MTQRRPRIKLAEHLANIRQLPCLVCDDNRGADAAHVKYSDSRAAKVSSGSMKDDRYVVPLCRRCHDQQHRMNERDFWNDKRIDPIQTAAFLFCASGDQEMGEKIIQEARGQPAYG